MNSGMNRFSKVPMWLNAAGNFVSYFNWNTLLQLQGGLVRDVMLSRHGVGKELAIG